MSNFRPESDTSIINGNANDFYLACKLLKFTADTINDNDSH
jgi:hypothetical protein